jgi:cytochrome c biogenesis protein
MTQSRLIRLRYLSSVRLTIALLILIVAASILGTVIPQNRRDELYRARYGDTFSRMLGSLQLTDVYHSHWYRALLAVFCINLCVCSTQRFMPLVKSLKRSSSTAGRVKLSDLPFYRKIQCGKSPIPLEDPSAGAEDIGAQIREVLARGLYRLRYADPDSGIYYFERGKIGRLGPMITHASIVIILIGGIFVGTFGFKEYKNIPVGETVDVPRSNFQVRADDFKVELYPDSRTPKEYTSVLTIIEDGVPRFTDAIEVNHPMKYKGVKFYQSDYGTIMADTVEIGLSRRDDGETLGRFRIHKGETFQVPDSQLRIKVVALVPDFVRDSSGRVGSRSREPRNPAVLLELYEDDELKDSMWSFLRFPDFHGSGKSDYSLRFLSITTKDYTILQISRDPGLSVVWIGSLLMVAGLFLSFYLSHKRIWIKLSVENDEPIMEVGGRSYKDRSGFEKELGRLETVFGRSGGD